jgi:transposase
MLMFGDNGSVLEQPALLELPEQAERPDGVPETGTPRPKKYAYINREQMAMRCFSLDSLIGEDHKARGIWELVGRLDLSKYERHIRSLEDEKGRPAWSPRLLASIWLYSYSEGITSARQIERLMEYEPGLQWLAGGEIINHHTLSDFRVQDKEALDSLFTQLLMTMEDAGWVSLQRVMHDGTKVRAQAGVDSFRREKTVAEKLAQAREVVLEDPQAEANAGNKRREAARQRAQREREQRLEDVLKQLHELQESKESAEEKSRVRASTSEPDARMMKHGDNAIAPSYNLQVSTDAGAGVIVGVQVTQSADDSHQLAPAVDEVKKNLGRDPQQVVADGGFTNRQSIVQMQERTVDFIGSLPDPAERSEAAMKSQGIDPKFAPHFFILQPDNNSLQCPAGKPLPYVGQSRKRGNHYLQYRADGNNCRACEYQKRCCPRSPERGRTVSQLQSEQIEVAQFREKMGTPEAKEIYRQRGATAEFPFAYIKEKFRMRKFRVSGKEKAGMEAVWACVTHNILIFLRLSAVNPQAGLAAA